MVPQTDLDTAASQRVLLALKEARARLEAAERAASEPIAVVGIGCRFPGGGNGPDAYRQLLQQGVDAVGSIPADRYDWAAHYSETPGTAGKMYVREGAFLDGIDQFDAAFFGISPREAVSLDPQQRLLLETGWEALEHAGLAPRWLRGSRCGVFMGLGRNDYAYRLLRDAPQDFSAWHATGNGLCYGPGRLAHVLDLKGPNMAIDTACSSSLLAVHTACQSLRLQECDLALAGGCHVHLSPQVAIVLCMSRALARDGRCKAFDAVADGFGLGEGCGIVVLRRLSDALERCDTILALIRGSATNHDGHSSGLTVPNQAAQEQVIRAALANARVAPDDIGYVEAHGTGTPLGDPIEIEALANVFCRDRRRDDPLKIGSAKTNLGHLEAAAGIAGLIKVVLSLQHGEIPPSLHLREPNPRIAWNEWPIEIPTRPIRWETGAKPRLAGVSSFGMSGTNVHVVLQEPPAHPRPQLPDRPLHIVTLSARSASALRAQARRLAARLSEPDAPLLPDVAFTENAGRTHFSVRVGLPAASIPELCEGLAAVAGGSREPSVLAEDALEAPKVAFLFSGQGSQYAGMGRELYETQPAFRHVLERCNAILRSDWKASLMEVLFSDAHDRRLDQTLYTQPALFAVEYALAELWRSWGVVPSAVLGHSVGEYAAACVAGVFTMEDGLRLIAERARLMQALPNGAMVAVQAPEKQVRAVIDAYRDDISIAAVNGAAGVVIAGRAEPMQAVVARLRDSGFGARPLNVSHAFHSPMMTPMLAPFAAVAAQLAYSAPRIALISNVTGVAQSEAPDASYWRSHVREAVRFADGIETLAGGGYQAFVEIGPGGTLLALAGRQLAERSPALLPSLLPGRADWQSLLKSLARLYELGVEVDWAGFDRDQPRRRVSLPTYPFERQRFWHDDRAAASSRAVPAYRLAWQQQPARDWPVARLGHPKRWLILAGRGGLGERLARSLELRGDSSILVTAGSAFAEIGDEHWELDPNHPADLAQLLMKLSDASRLAGIIHLWNCDAAPEGEPNGPTLLASQQRSCAGVIALVQALAALCASPTPLWLVTRNAIDAGEVRAQAPDLTRAGLWGLGRVIALEHSEYWGGQIDLAPEPNGDEAADLLRELDQADAEDAVCLRNGERYVARIEPISAPQHELAMVRGDGTYLVAGGLGALGLQVSRWLIEHGARNLVLLGRRPPSPGALTIIEEWRRSGVTVLTAPADVADPSDLRRVFDMIEARLPALRGVIHAAGVAGERAIAELDAETLASVLRPKVQGGWLLHQFTAALELDFFVCFSSIAALWGSKHQAHYAAANAFLDGLAHHRRRRGLPGLSINWGPWNGCGMATPDALDRLARIGIQPLAPADALSALQLQLGSAAPQIALANVNWTSFRQVFGIRRQRPLIEKLIAAEAPESLSAAPMQMGSLGIELASLLPTERHDRLVSHVEQAVVSILGLDGATPLDARTGFFRLGLDSTMAVELAGRLARDLRVALPPTIIFDNPTVTQLAAYLATETLGWAAAEQPAAPVPDPDTQSIAAKLARLESLLRDTGGGARQPS